MHSTSADTFFYPRVVQIILHLTAIITFATFPGWQKELDEDGEEQQFKSFPSTKMLVIIHVATWAAAFFGFVSALWQHAAAVTATRTVSATMYGIVDARTGPAAIWLVWISEFFNCVGLLGITTIREGIQVLASLVE